MKFLPLLVALLGLTLVHTAAAQTVRFATFNVSFYDTRAGRLAERLAAKKDRQAAAIAEIIQRVRPDVLLLNEFDYEQDGTAIKHFLTNYLSVGQHKSQSPLGPAEPIEFPYSFSAPSNTGRFSGHDLDRNGRIASQVGSREHGADCWGYGEYPGKFAMVLLSRYPINNAAIRTFQNFRWKDMPEARLPDDSETVTPHDWYTAQALEQFPLSSKSHWDVPIEIAGRQIHVLASHPTPPTFDGPEDRNGRRNHDEIRFWADYISPTASSYIYDDRGGKGGLDAAEAFVIMGDLNGDPADGQGMAGIARLLASPHVSTEMPPASAGGVEQAKLQGGANETHQGDPRLDTLDASDRIDSGRRGPGNLRVDYVIPASGLKTIASGVFWPKNKDTLFSLVGTYPFPSTDHRLVWIDIAAEPTVRRE